MSELTKQLESLGSISMEVDFLRETRPCSLCPLEAWKILINRATHTPPSLSDTYLLYFSQFRTLRLFKRESLQILMEIASWAGQSGNREEWTSHLLAMCATSTGQRVFGIVIEKYFSKILKIILNNIFSMFLNYFDVRISKIILKT